MASQPKSAPEPEYDVFICYRRGTGADIAGRIQEALYSRGRRAFLDTTDLHKGFFDQTLLTRIAETPSFLIVLSPNALDRCSQPGDWLQQEIAQAVASHRNIIPIFTPDFHKPKDVTPEADTALRSQGVRYDHVYFREMVDRIIHNLDDEAARREQQRLQEEQDRKRQEEEHEIQRQQEAERRRRLKEEQDRKRQEEEQENQRQQEAERQRRLKEEQDRKRQEEEQENQRQQEAERQRRLKEEQDRKRQEEEQENQRQQEAERQRRLKEEQDRKHQEEEQENQRQQKAERQRWLSRKEKFKQFVANRMAADRSAYARLEDPSNASPGSPEQLALASLEKEFRGVEREALDACVEAACRKLLSQPMSVAQTAKILNSLYIPPEIASPNLGRILFSLLFLVEWFSWMAALLFGFSGWAFWDRVTDRPFLLEMVVGSALLAVVSEWVRRKLFTYFNFEESASAAQKLHLARLYSWAGESDCALFQYASAAEHNAHAAHEAALAYDQAGRPDSARSYHKRAEELGYRENSPAKKQL